MPASSKDDLWVFVARKPRQSGVKLEKVALRDLASPRQQRRSVLDPTLGSQLEKAFALAVTEARRAQKKGAKRVSAPPKHRSAAR